MPFKGGSMPVTMANEQALALITPISRKQLREAQKCDPVIGPVLKKKLSASRPLFDDDDDDDGILYRITFACKELVLPESYKIKVLGDLHNNTGHRATE